MFGSGRVKLDKHLHEKVKKYAAIAGYSSPDEFVAHAVEKAIKEIEEADATSADEIKRRLKGLGYIS